jgi:succinate-semialdehyde dehydrogenase / glutarate-semialdehyde dehydrogenase
MYDDVSLMIDGAWGPGTSKQTIAILNPATSAEIGTARLCRRIRPRARREAAARAFRGWSKTSAFERYKLMRKAAELLRQRVEAIARTLTWRRASRWPRRAWKSSAPPTTSTGAPKRAAAPMAGSCRRAPPACCRSSSASRSGRWRRSRRGTSPSTRRCASSPARLPRAARSSSRGRRIRRARAPNWCAASSMPGIPDGLINLVYGTPSEISEYLSRIR